jgi:two-component system chemotaxis response regulator CheY
MNLPCDDEGLELSSRSWDDGSVSVTPDRLKAVIVDDDEMMRRLVRRALSSLGFKQIHAAENGADGVTLAEREMPDIIIADYHMPGMHGLDLVKAVRENEALDRTVIIMLSAADEQDVIEGARVLGADTFMVKPFERADLKRLIETLYHRFNCATIAWPE